MSCNTNSALFPLVVCIDEDNLKLVCKKHFKPHESSFDPS